MQVIQGCTCLDTFHSIIAWHDASWPPRWCSKMHPMVPWFLSTFRVHPVVPIGCHGSSAGTQPWMMRRYPCKEPWASHDLPVGYAWCILMRHAMKNLGSFAGNKFFIVFQFARLTVKTHRAMDLASPLENGFVWVCLAHRGDRIAPIFAVLSHDFGGLKHVTSFDFDNFSGLWDENNDCKTNWSCTTSELPRPAAPRAARAAPPRGLLDLATSWVTSWVTSWDVTLQWPSSFPVFPFLLGDLQCEVGPLSDGSRVDDFYWRFVWNFSKHWWVH